ncbi:BBSome-interacting protein 1 isoform X2 [Equus quagga]|uniref:BBSome-interacting protein 1 isoform X2 n=1 Tax=Equus quagga TaxID=89248 RepID=UPI001EE35A88|nr:BBSome-interacting protein 1 isoform X2 [Equus quagga]
MGSWRKGGNSLHPRRPRECPFRQESRSESSVPRPRPVGQARAGRSLGDGAPRRRAGLGTASAGRRFSFRAGQAAARPPCAPLRLPVGRGRSTGPLRPAAASRHGRGAGRGAEPLIGGRWSCWPHPRSSFCRLESRT